MLVIIFSQDINAIGPGIGPVAVPPPLTSLPPPPSSLPAPPAASGAYSAATVASGPQPASVPSQPPVMLPPLHFQGLGASQPFGYQPPAATGGMPPARMGASGVQAGMVRSADQMEGDGAAELPPQKRQKVAKLPGGALYPEEDWIAMHPVSFSLLCVSVIVDDLRGTCLKLVPYIPPSTDAKRSFQT